MSKNQSTKQSPTFAPKFSFYKLIIFIFWLGVFIYSVYKHTPWRDEYQSWLVSTQTTSFGDFVDGIRHERHPPLHYLIQRFFNTFDLIRQFPTGLQIQLSTAPFVIGSAILLVFLLNLPWWLSLPLLFNPFYFREFGVISRCYSLGVFFLFLSLYFEKKEKSTLRNFSLLLSAGTHLLFTLGISIFFLIECFRSPPSIKHFLQYVKSHLVTLFGLLLLILFQIPPADTAFVSGLTYDWNRFQTGFYYLLVSLTGGEKFWQAYEWGNFAFSDDSAPLILIGVLYWCFKKYKNMKALIIPAFLSFFLTLSYGANYRHLGVGFFFFVFSICRLHKNHRPLDPLVFLSGFMVIFTLNWWLRWAPWQTTPNFAFSAAPELIQALQQELYETPLPPANANPRKKPLPEPVSISLIRMNPKWPLPVMIVDDETPFYTYMGEAKTKVFSSQKNRWVSYPYFTKRDHYFNLANWCQQYRNSFIQNYNHQPLFLGLQKNTLLPKECEPAKLVYKTNSTILTDESFVIYKLN